MQGHKEEKGSLDWSAAEEEMSKDYDRSQEEVVSQLHREDPSMFVKTNNHSMDAEGDMSSSNTGREKYRRLRKDKREEPSYYQP